MPGNSRYTKHIMRVIKERMWVPIELKENTSTGNSTTASIYGSDKQTPLYDNDPMSVEPEEEEFRLTANHMLCLLVLCFGMAVVALDYSGIGNIMSTVSSDLHGTTIQSEWIGNGYSLAACVSQLPTSSLSDIFGRKNAYMGALTLFLVGSIICGTSKNMEALIAGRVIQGAGGGGLMVLPEVIIADIIPLRQRSMYYCIFMLVWCVFTGSAPLIAGALAEYSSWRWYFYLNLFVGGAALVGCPFFMRMKHDHHSKTWRHQLKTVDYIGAVLIVSSTTSLLLALSRGGSSDSLPWSNWSVILSLVLGVAGIIATGFYEHFAKLQFPMFNFRVFCNPSAILCYWQNVFQGVVNMGIVYFLPTFFQGAKGYGELVSGLCVLPLELVGPPIVLVIGYIIERLGHYHFVNLIMWAIATLGAGLLTLMDEHRGIGGLLMLQIPTSIGISCLYATLSITTNATNPPHLWTDSTAMMSFCRAIGDSLGTAIGGAVFASQMRTRLSELAAKGINVPEVSFLSIVHVIKGMEDPAKADVIIALTGTMRTLFFVMTAFSGLGFVTTLMQKEYSLDQTYVPKQGIALE